MAYPLDLSGAARCAAIKIASVIFLIVRHGVDSRCVDGLLKSVGFKNSFSQNESLSLLLRYSNQYRKVQNAPVPPRSFTQTGKNLAWHPKEYVITYISAVRKSHYVKKPFSERVRIVLPSLMITRLFAFVKRNGWICLPKISATYKGAHKTVILKITTVASVRQDW